MKMMITGLVARVWLSLMAALFGEFPPAAGPRVAVELANGGRREGVLESWTWQGALAVTTTDQSSGRIQQADVARVTMLDAKVTTPTGRLRWLGRDGSRFSAEIVSGDEEMVVARHALLGELAIPLEAIAEIAGSSTGPVETAAAPPQDDTRDLIVLANGDRLSGTVERIGPDGVKLSVGDATRDLGWDVARDVRLAATGETPARQGAIVELVDGARFSVSRLQWGEDGVEIRTLGEVAARVPLAHLRAIDLGGGRRVRLAEIPPTRVEMRSFFGRSWPVRIDANTVGDGMRVDGEAATGGIGLHASGRVSWALNGGYTRLLGRIGVDDSAGPLADATVWILLDDRPIATFDALRWNAAARAIDADISGGKTLTIVIDGGRNGDTQDRVDLIEPVLLKK